jgi:hypothetical protein
MISQVAASERERAQTMYMLKPRSVVYMGSWDLLSICLACGKSYKIDC